MSRSMFWSPTRILRFRVSTLGSESVYDSETAVELLFLLLSQDFPLFVQNLFCGDASSKSGERVKGGKELGAAQGAHGRVFDIEGIVGG